MIMATGLVADIGNILQQHLFW
ncbi:hypothetical protein OB2597_20911 [Pseudooceanicola batsensis HTCC2597]|uniref:Uncharacterized protein n=1 Tax=Pseudooceanicola batsensis (strain ATCC BAA-863 / DSM 15984 / KCTC 12145 / HTCC2597) TaxID=252305 RepID=A3U1E2_PSEBH|nr:hypothetical protein OB2597_20911 [Pseudooceanicola batsensis HTCC2597]